MPSVNYLNERAVQLALWQHLLASCEWVIPNFTPDRWWEADIWAITKAGMTREYEIKLSRSDFLQDAQKSRQNIVRETHHKHQLLAAKSDRGPTQFFFVTRKGIVQPEEIPEWAGWMEFDKAAYNPQVIWVHEKRKAPRLHKQKVDITNTSLFRTFYYRYWTEAKKRYLSGLEHKEFRNRGKP